MEYGDLRWAMRNMLSRGMQIPQGGTMQGLRDMLKQMRERKKQQLERYDLSSIFDGFRERLEEILDMERSRIDEWLNKDPDGQRFLRRRAEEHCRKQQAAAGSTARTTWPARSKRWRSTNF